jgi:Copper type II ascorbate-dependent monooxygenase, C-terminal domain
MAPEALFRMNFPFAWQRTSCLFSAWIALVVGCGDDDARPKRPDTPEDAAVADDEDASADEEQANASSSGPDGSSPSLPSGPSDRCFEGSCAPAVLPEQPEYGYLSDAGDGWLRLVEAAWELGPKSEGYRCVRTTIHEDIYISGFKPLNPTGAHHATLHVESSATQPDGVSVCGVGSGGVRRLQGSGVGTEATELPPGVAMKLAAGEQLMVNMHLFNVASEPLRGTSGVWIKRVPKTEVMQEAETILAGPLSLSIPPGMATQKGTCTLRKAVTLFSVGPHMHQLGRYMKVTAKSALMGERVLFDGPYDFTHQLSYKLSNIEMAAGDTVSVECTYMNDSARTVNWGDSTLDEMCFAGLALYPAFGAGGFPCTN